jgi:cytochrome c553
MKKIIFSMVVGLGMVSQANAFAGDAAAGKAKAAVCAACHGANGIGTTDQYPNLAGQHADYIVKQLKAFKSGDRKDPVMAPMAMGLSEQDMADVASYFSSFGLDGSSGAAEGGDSTAAAPATPAEPAFVADASKGKALYEHGDKARGITACVDCHGKEGASKVLINPNLANQHPEYIEKQLRDFKANTRHNASMNQVSGNLSDEDIANLGAYFKDPSAVGEVAASAGKVAVKTLAGDVALGKTKSATCAACHGADGNAAVAMYPSLAGQSEAYLVKQLKDFKSGNRENGVMAGMVAGLNEADMQNLAAYFASQTLKPAPATTSAAGQKLYVSGDAKRGITACIACHAVDGKGMDFAAFPAIAGQNAAYLKSQLEQFRSGTRGNDRNSIMRNIAVKLSDDDIAALADYMSALK